jgi:beta-N-acetylhexosaminidase
VGLSREELAARDLVPYARLVTQAPALVVSSAAFTAYDPVTPAALTPAIVRGLLRDELGFTGVAITDDLAGVTAATGGTAGEAAEAALRAGADMVQVSDPAEAEAAYRHVLAAKLPAARLREALHRVLALKRGLT